jgi:hypothetical protein
MIVDPDFLDHWRTRMLVNALSDEMAPLYVLRVWSHCQNRRSVSFEGMSAEGLKALCRYGGDARALETALINAEFVARKADTIEVCKWADHNAKLLANWENGRNGGRPPKPNGNPTETHDEPNGDLENPSRTDKRRQEESKRRQEEIPHESMGNRKSNGSTPDGRLPVDAGKEGEGSDDQPYDLSGLDWEHVTSMAESVARKIPPTCTDGRRCWLKYAVLAEITFSEHWLMDSVEAVLAARKSRKTPQAHFVSVLQSKAAEQNVDITTFKALMKRIEIPKAIWKSSVLEIQK